MSRSVRRRRSGLPQSFSSLRQRNFRLYWAGQVISLAGAAMQAIGQVWLVLEISHSAWQLGLVSALQSVPILIFSLLGGIAADRWPKRDILLATQTVSMLQSLVLWILVATGTAQLWHLYVLALLLGFVSSVERPASRSFIVEMAGREDVSNAVALYSSGSTLARIVGPGIAGIIIAVGGMPVLFLLNAVSFFPVIAALALMKTHDLHAQPRPLLGTQVRQTAWRQLREGVMFVWNMPAAGFVILLVGLVLLFGSNFNVVLPVFAIRVLRVGAAGFGLLSAATGIGALLGALWLAGSSRQPTIQGVIVGTLIFGVVEAMFAVVHIYVLSLLLIAAVGFAESVFAAQAITALQILTPDHLRGRVVSVQVLSFDGSLPLGSLLMGWLSHLYGASSALLIGALLSILVAAVGWAVRQPAERNAAQRAERP